MARDEDEDTRPLRFGATREGHKPEGQRQRDAEDAYWEPAYTEYRCPYCGDSMPSGYEREMWVCCGEVGHALSEQEQLDADADYQNWLNHMREIAHEGT